MLRTVCFCLVVSYLCRFLIIASDGVFEFLTNQSVADMVARYPDPLDACKKVVQEAYDLWLQYEVRTDDITIICVYVGEPWREVEKDDGDEMVPPTFEKKQLQPSLPYALLIRSLV